MWRCRANWLGVFFRLGIYPVLGLWLVWVSLLQRVTFEKRKSNQNALAPPLGASLRLGMPAHRLESVGRRDGPSLAQRG